MFRRILVPTDFSPASQAALAQARQLAEHFGSSLQIVHVAEEPASSSGFVADGFAPASDDMREGQLARARQTLAALVSASDRKRLHVRTDVLTGVAATAIVDYAAATGTNLIVMGTHGRTGLAHLLMGSVAEHVVRTAPCAVLIVRPAATARDAAMLPAAARCAPLPA